MVSIRLFLRHNCCHFFSDPDNDLNVDVNNDNNDNWSSRSVITSRFQYHYVLFYLDLTFSFFSTSSVADPGISRRRGANPKGVHQPIILAIFSRKVYAIEKIGPKGEGAHP